MAPIAVLLAPFGANGARFFTNAIDTRTNGVDVTANYHLALDAAGDLRLRVGYNNTRTRIVGAVETPAELAGYESVLFNRIEQRRIPRPEAVRSSLDAAWRCGVEFSSASADSAQPGVRCPAQHESPCRRLPMPELRVSRFLTFCSFSLFAASAFAAGPHVVKNARHDTSLPLARLAVGARLPSNQPDREIAEPRATRGLFASGRADAVAKTLSWPLTGVSTVIGFDGQSAADNRRVFGFAFVPPDTNGAVGASQYVQMVNVTIAVYDKRDGSLQLGPAPIHSLWTGFGGLCENGGEADTFSDGGDPVVLYDHLADRWMVSQLQYDETFSNNAQCIAISTSSDATGSYNRYEFDFVPDFPDYPKFGIWPDAYYNSINVFGDRGFAGAEACAFDRAAMLAGAAATAVCFQQSPSVSSLLPADLDGSTLPPAGAPNYFVGLADATHLNLFRFHVDFANPAASTFSAPVPIEVSGYNEICARAIARSCIPEPAPGEKVDGLADRVMFRLAYRNFGDHEALVVNHTVRGGALGGVRWYEIRNPAGTPTVFQQGTIVDPDTDFWLGSIAMDQAGNIAVGFNAMSKNDFSSVYVAGRKASDAPGVMFGPLRLALGSGVQFNSYKRWGDYSSMTVDPKDDCTFWYTQEYYIATGRVNWATYVGAFKFDNCTSGGK